MYIAVCAVVFLVAYLINTTTISMLYHRGLAHGAVKLPPWLVRFTAAWGNWLTGLDPKGWVCMHRMHHTHSDTAEDPHSPLNHGVFPLLMRQLKSYERILIGLSRNEEKYTSVVADIDMDISWLNRKRLWYIPYVVHLSVGLALAIAGGWWLLGACYFFGIMSHPVEGWLVNAFGHAYGGRNFDTSDNSRNNIPVALAVMGEGYQNNHHAHPRSAKFSYQWYEIDMGYALIRVFDALGVVEIDREHLIPRPGEAKADEFDEFDAFDNVPVERPSLSKAA